MITCPSCGAVYEPAVEDPADAPDQSIEKEQHMTGLCSDECWDEWLGVDRDV